MYSVEIFEVFPWNKNLETGIKTIDEQHKELVKLLNLLASHIAKQSDIIILNEVLERLGAYADYHFTTEEAIWHEYLKDDEFFISHKKTHDSFEREIEHFLENRSSKSEYEIIEEILKFLIGWLAMHILDSDKRLAIMVQEMQNGMLLDLAKKSANAKMSGAQGLLIETVLEMYESVSARTLELLKERTERMKLENELKKSQENEKIFNDAVMNSVPGLVALYNEKAELIRWNKGHIKELGYTNDELKHKNLFEFFHTYEQEEIAQVLKQIKEEGYTEIEHTVLKKDETEIPYLLRGVNFKFQSKDYFLVIGVDISGIKQTELELREALLGIIISVSKAMETRDPYTAGHQERVSKISVAIAKRMEMQEHQIEGLRLGASIHDIGKLAIPAELLTKPSRLSDIEYAMIKTHAEAGANIMRNIKFPWPILEIVSQHHERIDGSGYPLGLTGDEMTIEAKIVAVADVFEAMSSHRPYRPSLGAESAVEELKRNSGKLYDAKVVEMLLEVLENEPDSLNL